MPRVLPGTGGIVLSHRVGDPCVGLAGDHVEPGVRSATRAARSAARRRQPGAADPSCVGNARGRVSGPCAGARGVVTGKHGGVDTVLVDFPLETMRRIAVGDRMQVYAYGLGLSCSTIPS